MGRGSSGSRGSRSSGAGGSSPTTGGNTATQDAILDSYRRLSARSEYEDGLVDLPRILARAQLANPGLTREEFHSSILDLARTTGLQLRFANEPSRIPDARSGLWYSPSERRIVDLTRERNPPWDAGLYQYAYIPPARLREVMSGGGRR